jgi:cytochrome b pre-mRNA-processing protein 3
MLWPFNLFRKSPASRGTIEAIYGAIVAQARQPAFYAKLGVPDTVNGRLDMVILHLWLTLRRLRVNGDADGLGQSLIDHFCSDMDDNLRELGTSDLKVPKRLLEFNEALYGRARAYDEALAAGGPEPLVKALVRNIYAGQSVPAASGLADYVVAAIASLDGLDAESLTRGDLRFPTPSERPAKGDSA